VGIDELCSSLTDDERKRVPVGTIGAFISDATQRAYPLTERVVNFLEGGSLRVQTKSLGTASSILPTNPDDGVKQSVREWYDKFGWQTNEQGFYNDTAIFSQATPTGHGLYELMSHLSILDRLAGGGFMLDAASGAIAHPEYLAFSWFFKSRVCVDMSITALTEAKSKLRQTDLCCLADICSLPFRDETFDGAISGYTIQHIPESQQLRAVKELYRVIRPNAHLCIFTEVRRSMIRKGLFFLLRFGRKLLKVSHLIRSPLPIPSSKHVESPANRLYFFAREITWWKNVARSLTSRYSIESHMILNKSEFEQWFGRSNSAAKALRLVQNAFPRLSSGISAYCLIDICKPAKSDL
jgi:ubiquinone/menaquinone biosynthesis C-methylase UbiE